MPHSDWAVDSTGMPCRQVKHVEDPLTSAVKPTHCALKWLYALRLKLYSLPHQLHTS